MTQAISFILASKSQSRAKLLANAGLSFDVKPAGVDEDSVKASLLEQDASGKDIATTLAELKAQAVQADPLIYVLGADQVLICEDQLYNKPRNAKDIHDQLNALRGKTHTLISAVAIAKAGSVLWRHVDEARLTMRDFSAAFLDDYIARNEQEIMQSVGAYKLEGEGSHLFSQIEGDYFTILGLPLLPVLDFFRLHEVLPS